MFAFRQYRRQGADEALAAWTLAAVFVAASVSLALVAAVGVTVAGAEGAGLDLVGVTVGVLVGALALGAVFLQRRALVWLVSASVRVTRRVVGWPRGELATQVDFIIARLTVVTLRLRQVLSVVGWGVANWVLDCACLALSFLAIGAGIPWRGLLLAYGAGQLAANLPITPGGLGRGGGEPHHRAGAVRRRRDLDGGGCASVPDPELLGRAAHRLGDVGRPGVVGPSRSSSRQVPDSVIGKAAL